MSSNKPPPTNNDAKAVVKKGLYVYFDNIMKTAKEENDALKEKYQRLHDQLMEIRLKHNEADLAVMQTSDFDEEDEDMYRYNINGTDTNIVLDQVHDFCCTLAGTYLEADDCFFERFRHKLYFDDDGSLKINVAVTDGVRLIATLTGYPGSREEIEDIILRSVNTVFFMNLGRINIRTNQPIMDALLGAVLQLEQLVIPRAEVEPILKVHSPELSEHARELERLSQAYSNHTGVRNATTLTFANEKLKSTRDYYQSVCFSGESGEFLRLDLEKGKVGTLLSKTNEEIKSWSMQLPTESIPLSSLKDFTVHLGGITLYARSSRPVQVPGGFSLNDDPFSRSEIIFRYDESFSTFFQEGGDLDSFLMGLVAEISIVNHQNGFRVTRHRPEELEGMTIEPLLLQVRLDIIRAQMEELGIEVTAGNGSDETS